VAAFLEKDDFFILRHGMVWEAIRAVHERGESIDNLTVTEELRLRKQLDQVGGPAFITYLMNNTPTHIHAETYGHMVERAATRRRLLKAAQEVAKAAIQEDADIDEVVNRSEAALFGVTERRLKREVVPMSYAVRQYFERLEHLYAHRDEPLGLPSGFTDLDRLLGGMQKSDLIIVAARPGVGKTSFLLSVAMNAARSVKARVAIFSMEMSQEQLVQRFFAAETGINSQKLRLGNLDEHEWERSIEATSRLFPVPIYIDDTPALNVSQIRTKCRRLYREFGLDMILVDYLQLMNSGVRSENRVQEISVISRGLKELARELNVPVMSAAQLSRAVEQRGDKRPQLSYLRESGSIEQDADIVIFLYRDELYNENTDRPNQADIIVAKHRNGPTGVITLYFQKDLTQFRNMQKSNINLSSYSGA
jgi:replicative DNA helicase